MKDSKVIEEVKKQITELTEKKSQQMEVIQAELSKIRTKKAAAEDAAAEAAAAMDLKAWTSAETDMKTAENAEKMFSARLSQIQREEMISEEESDRVVDRLKDYIKAAETEFDADLKKILQDLHTLYNSHISNIQDAENVIQTWTQNVHKNYRSATASYFDPETGTHTNRSPFPVPVHLSDGQGGGHARMVRQFLSNFETLLADPEEEADE